MKNLICKIFGHNFKYFFTMMDSPKRIFRTCPRCNRMAEYKNMQKYGSPVECYAWVWLLGLTKKGARKLLASHGLNSKGEPMKGAGDHK